MSPGGSLELILEEFERIGYKCNHKFLNSADFGIPQTRERLFIVGSRDHETFKWPKPTHAKTHQEQPNLFSQTLKPWVGMYEALWRKGTFLFSVNLINLRLFFWVKNVVRPHDEPVTWNIDRPSPTIGAHQSAKLAYRTRRSARRTVISPTMAYIR